MIESHNNGMSSMLMNGRVNQERENSMKNMDFTSKDHSTSNLPLELTDTLKLSTTETWSSRLQTVTRLKFGGSINRHSPSRPSSTTNHGILNLRVRLTRCKSMPLTHNGSRSSSSEDNNSSTSERIKRFLMSMVPRMRKPERLLLTRTMVESTRDGMLSILIKLPRMRLRDLMKNSVSTSTDHSTSDQ